MGPLRGKPVVHVPVDHVEPLAADLDAALREADVAQQPLQLTGVEAEPSPLLTRSQACEQLALPTPALIEIPNHERLRATFNQAADLYDRARPGYPPALFDDLAELAGVGPGCRVLEIGPGTGQATVPLAERGCHVVAAASEQPHDLRGVDEDVVVPLVVAAPAAVLVADEGRDLANESVGLRQREPRDDRPVVFNPCQVGAVTAGLTPHCRSHRSKASTPPGRSAPAMASAARATAASSLR